MNPLDSLVKLGLGIIERGEMQAWTRLLVSCAITVLVALLGIFGLTLGALLASGVAPGLAIATALAACTTSAATALVTLWQKSTLTKNIPILYSFRIEAARIAALQKDGDVFNDRKDTK